MKDQFATTVSQQSTQKPSRFSGGWDEELVPLGTIFHGGYEDEELVGDVTFHQSECEKSLREDRDSHMDSICEIADRNQRGEISRSDADSLIRSHEFSIDCIDRELERIGRDD